MSFLCVRSPRPGSSHQGSWAAQIPGNLFLFIELTCAGMLLDPLNYVLLLRAQHQGKSTDLVKEGVQSPARNKGEREVVFQPETQLGR